jgi:hypothetical protein
MTCTEALFRFWNGFGIAAYEKNAVPERGDGNTPLSFPYLTYEVETDGFGQTVSLGASLWFLSSSWERAEEKQEEIARYIGRGGVFLPYDGGVIWIRRGSPFAKRAGDHADDMVKQIKINVSVEFWTEE